MRRLRPGEKLDPLEILEAAPSISRMQIPFPVSITLPPPTLTTQSAPFFAGEGGGAIHDADPRILGHVAPDAGAPLPERLPNPSTSPAFITPGSVTTSALAAAETGHLDIDVARRPGAEDDLRRTEIDKRQIPIVSHGCPSCGFLRRHFELTVRAAFARMASPGRAALLAAHCRMRRSFDPHLFPAIPVKSVRLHASSGQIVSISQSRSITLFTVLMFRTT